MRDLYKRLGVKNKGNVHEIIEAVKKCPNASLKKDAHFILSDLSRKRQYDNLNDTLKVIGELRPSLGLSHTEFWDGDLAVEYTNESQGNSSALDDLNGKIKNLNKGKAAEKVTDKGVLAGIGRLWWVLPLLLMAYSYFAYEAGQPRDRSGYSSSSPENSVSSRDEVSNNYDPVALPLTGTVHRFTSHEPLAPLEIVASSGNNYYVKLKDINNGLRDVMSIFVRRGERANVEVPLGTYQLTYAAGDTWYGPDLRFGEDTAYSKADESFRFNIEGNYINGYTVELRMVRHGNLETRRIDESQF